MSGIRTSSGEYGPPPPGRTMLDHTLDYHAARSRKPYRVRADAIAHAREGLRLHPHHAELMERIKAGARHGAPEVFTVAYINHGRWVARCPLCNSADLASRNDRRYYCVECECAEVEHAPLRVVWPDETTERAVETILLLRPHPVNQNWHPYETVIDLMKENQGHGL